MNHTLHRVIMLTHKTVVDKVVQTWLCIICVCREKCRWGKGGCHRHLHWRTERSQSQVIKIEIGNLHNNTLSRRPTTTTVHSNDTLVDTPFQLISDFFHVNQGVFVFWACWTSLIQEYVGGGGGGATGLLNKGGGSNMQASWFSN